MLEIDEAPSGEEIDAGKQNARERLGLWKKRGLYSTGAFFLSCAIVYLFLAGQPLHAYWESIGKYLLLLSMALLVVFVYCNALWWGAWSLLRDLKRTNTSDQQGE